MWWGLRWNCCDGDWLLQMGVQFGRVVDCRPDFAHDDLIVGQQAKFKFTFSCWHHTDELAFEHRCLFMQVVLADPGQAAANLLHVGILKCFPARLQLGRRQRSNRGKAQRASGASGADQNIQAMATNAWIPTICAMRVPRHCSIHNKPTFTPMHGNVAIVRQNSLVSGIATRDLTKHIARINVMARTSNSIVQYPDRERCRAGFDDQLSCRKAIMTCATASKIAIFSFLLVEITPQKE
jgi:hypothetical protein